jgi:hypothetical protein
MNLPINVKFPNNISKKQMGFNSAFKGLIAYTCAGNFATTATFDLKSCKWCKSLSTAEGV